MSKWFRPVLVTAMMAVLAVAAEALAAPVVLPRAGQVGVGAQGQFGTLLKSGSLGEDFGSGGGFTVRLRYRMRYERALGLSFERQGFDFRGTADRDTVPTQMTIITSGAEIYQMFGTRTRTTKMLSFGAGVAQISRKLVNKETEFVNDGIYVSLGAGLEHFFWRSWAYDLSTRYMVLFQEGKSNHDFQVSLGLIFYAAY